MVDDSALNDRTVEKWPTIIGRGQEMAQNVGCARRFTEYRHITRIAAEFLDETMDPLHRSSLVVETIVPDA
jgi:hypothetical protein